MAQKRAQGQGEEEGDWGAWDVESYRREVVIERKENEVQLQKFKTVFRFSPTWKVLSVASLKSVGWVEVSSVVMVKSVAPTNVLAGR